MTQSEILIHELCPGVTQVTLNRPEKRNALSLSLLESFCHAIETVETRVLVLRGSGKVFCAGLDLEEAMNLQTVQRSAQWVSRALQSLYSHSAVTIAMIQGAALAGGAGLLAACDLVIAEQKAQIGFPETRRGLVAALVMAVLRRRLPGCYLNELLLLGEPITASRAWEIGLAHRVVHEDRLELEMRELAAHVLKGAPLATTRTKRLLDALEPRTLADELSRALVAHAEVRASEEAVEGIRAFLDKRRPSWNE